MELARCPECGASVGGRNHTAVRGVTRAVDMEIQGTKLRCEQTSNISTPIILTVRQRYNIELCESVKYVSSYRHIYFYLIWFHQCDTTKKVSVNSNNMSVI